MTPLPRTAELVLVTPRGVLLGRLPPVAVATPWWQDVEPVVRAARECHGVEVTVLRLLDAERERPPGGRVTYLAELAPDVPPDAVATEPWAGTLDDHPRRNPFGRPGGPAADLAWARSVLIEQGLRPAGRPVQVRSWNLSSLWRVPVDGQTAWLKVVPLFFAHEGRLLARLAGERVPRLLGQDGGRMLLAEIAGEDLYNADRLLLQAMTGLLVGLQRKWSGRTDELIALGLPDWRAAALGPAIAAVIARTADELAAEDRAALELFERDLPMRFAELAACGIADTLVHGDFHAGNLRGDGSRLTLLDWGDSGVGHPLLDQPAFLGRIPNDAVEPVREHWLRLWREALPGSDPVRASALIAPIAAARQAVIYRGFLDAIEPAEHPYHRSDPAAWLTRAAGLIRAASRARPLCR